MLSGKFLGSGLYKSTTTRSKGSKSAVLIVRACRELDFKETSRLRFASLEEYKSFLNASRCFLFVLSAKILAKINLSKLLTLPSKSNPPTTDFPLYPLTLTYFIVPSVPQNLTDFRSRTLSKGSKIFLVNTAANIFLTGILFIVFKVTSRLPANIFRSCGGALEE